MSGKQIDIGDNLCACFKPCGSAYSAAFADTVTGGWSLERAEYKLVVTYKIETCPVPAEAFFEGCADIGQYTDPFCFAFNEKCELGDKLSVACGFICVGGKGEGCFQGEN